MSLIFFRLFRVSRLDGSRTCLWQVNSLSLSERRGKTQPSKLLSLGSQDDIDNNIPTDFPFFRSLRWCGCCWCHPTLWCSLSLSFNHKDMIWNPFPEMWLGRNIPTVPYINNKERVLRCPSKSNFIFFAQAIYICLFDLFAAEAEYKNIFIPSSKKVTHHQQQQFCKQVSPKSEVYFVKLIQYAISFF